MDKKGQNREVMRRRILDAAKKLFVKEGFENVSMRRIAKAIDYSPAALYRYFSNKREIFSTLREEGFARFGEQQNQRRREYTDPLERLKAGGIGYIQYALDEPDYYHLMFSADCNEVALEGDLAQNALASFQNFRASVDECVQTGHFGTVETEVVAFTLWANVHGLARLVSTGQIEILARDMSLDVLLQAIIDFQLRPGCPDTKGGEP